MPLICFNLYLMIMKNKKLLLSLIAVLFTASASFAQISFNVGGGYHMDAFTEGGGMTGTLKVEGTSATADYENVYYSLGGGTPIFFGVGVGIMENLTFNADFGYWPNKTRTVVDLSEDYGAGPMTTLAEVESFQFRFNPGVTFGGAQGLYGRVGMSIPLAGTTKTMLDIKADGELFVKQTSESKGEFSVGAQTALGYKVPVAENMTLGFEVQAIALRIKGTSETVTDYEDFLGRKLDDLDVYDKETTYVDVMDEKSNNEDINPLYSTDKPMEDWADRSSFGSWGFNVRFAYTLNN